MAIIKSGSSTDQLTVDPISKAARVTAYNPDGSLALVSVKASYLAFTPTFSPGATPQDIFSITGSATKLVRVLSFYLSVGQTAAGVNSWQIVRRSTANSGGTSAAVSPIRSDLNDPVQTATVLQYTANPTAGTLVGNAWAGQVGAVTPTTAGIPGLVGLYINFTEELGKPIILRSAADVLAWNFGGVALPAGLAVRCGCRWTEE